MMNGNRKQTQREAAGFPLLSCQELLECLLALGMSVAVEDISKPSPQTTQVIFAQLVEILMGAPMDAMDGAKNALLGMMEYKEIYSEALQFTMFYRHCRKLAVVCGVDAFNLSDLTKPEATRLRTVLSGIMNFAKFRESRSPYRESLIHRVQTQADKTAKLHREVSKIEADIEDIKAKNAEDRPKTEEAKRVNENLRKELGELKNEQSRLILEFDESKRERAALVEKASNTSQEINQLQIKHTAARSRLVQSPERIKRYISDMSSDFTNEKKQLSDRQRTARDLQNRNEIICNLQRDLQDLIELSRGIETRRSKLAETQRIKSSAIGKLDQKKIESQGHDAKLDQLDRQIRNAEEKVARQREMTSDMNDRHIAKMADLKAQYVTKSKERTVWQRKRDQLLTEQKQLEQETEEFLAKHDAELNGLLAEYSKIRHDADKYMDDMAREMNMAV